MSGTHVVARLDSAASATLDALAPLVYRHPPPEGLPGYVPSASALRRFGDMRGNKHLTLDLEACVTLSDGRFVAFGSGSMPEREHLVVSNGRDSPAVVPATQFYAVVRTAAQPILSSL